MPKFKALRGNLSVRFAFKRPILNWDGTAAKYFELIMDALGSKFAVQSSEFSLQPAIRLSDVYARFNLYGGANSITLQSDKLVFDFSNLMESDYPVAYEIMQAIHDRFEEYFPTVDYDRIEASSSRHLELLPPAEVSAYLESFPKRDISSKFSNVGSVVQEPAVRFAISARDGSWNCRFGAEASMLSPTAIFVDLNFTMRGMNKSVPFLDKLRFAESLGSACRDVLELEANDE